MPNPVITLWVDPPAMDSGAPIPAIYSDATGVVCGYVIGPNHRDSGKTAVLHFDGVLHYSMGHPNDEALSGHPLYSHGLRHYSFHLITDSPLTEELDRRNRVHRQHVAGSFKERFRHWVITFHDETVEVVAESATVVCVTNEEPGAAVRRLELRQQR